MRAELVRLVRFLPENAPPGERRDVEGQLLHPGTPVLCHPLAPHEFMEDTETNRARFELLDYAWTVRTRQRVWFPPVKDLSTKLHSEMEKAQALMAVFFGTLDENMKAAPGAPFPIVHMPGWFKFIPWDWEPKIKRTVQAADLTVEIAKIIGLHSGIPESVTWPEEWTRLARRCNGMRVYALDGLHSTIHVVVAFVTPLQFAPGNEPRGVVPGQNAITAIRHVYEQWLAAAMHPAVSFTFFTLGSPVGVNPRRQTDGNEDADPMLTHEPRRSRGNETHSSRANQSLLTPPPTIEEEVLGPAACAKPKEAFHELGARQREGEAAHAWAAGDFWVVLSSQGANNRWETCIPPRFSDRKWLRDFSDQLLPETKRQRQARIKDCVDEMLRTCGGNVTVELLAEETGYRRRVVRECFLMLQENGPDVYRLYRTSGQQLAVRRTQNGDPARIRSASFPRRFLRRHGLHVFNTSFFLAVGQWVGQFINRGVGWGFVIGLLIAYIANCLRADLKRRLSQDEE